MRRWLSAALLFLSLSADAQAPADRRLAVTFDDLPFAAAPADDTAALQAYTRRLLDALGAQGVPAVGFVNEGRLYRDGNLDEPRVDLLRQWLAAGHELGNHTYSHLSLNRVPLEVFAADLLRGEAVTRPLLHGQGRPLRWFRHPFLHLGQAADKRSGMRDVLAQHGYTVAPVTVNSSEWLFAAAYAQALAQDDRDAARRIGEAYVPYMEAVFARTEQLSFDLFGRNIPHVLVLHANALNADRFTALADMLRQRGYRFIPLDEALRDAAYQSVPGIDSHEGESWLELWSRQAGLRPGQEVPVPAFVTRWAGPASYRGY